MSTISNDFPQVIDESTLTGVFQADTYLSVGVEGEMVATGDGTVGLPEVIRSAEDATTAFGVGSSLTDIVIFLLGRGYSEVKAVASASGTAPTLVERQTAWEALADDDTVRIRLTDSVAQADLVALADSCENAELIQNKQFCFAALSLPSSKAGLIAAAGAIASKRAVLVGPGVYDLDGNLLSGGMLAALAAAEVAKNPDITDSLNLAEIPATAGIEKEAATGLPVFRLRANAGAPIDDFQDLLTGGASPFKQADSGLAQFTHLRTTWTTDDTFDALQTLLIKDEVFLGIKQELLDQKFLRRPNTLDNRNMASAIVDSWLKAHDTWVEPIVLPNGTTGYGVTTVDGIDGKSFTVNYFGQVVRGDNVISINGTLTIAA